jgi:glycosyltransferase involved in cell wall biosynthesis
MDIVCFSSSDWHGKWGSRQQVMLRFARRGYRVLFVERPAGLEHLLRYPDLRRRKSRRWREGVRSVSENLWIVSLPPLLPGRYYAPSVNAVNQWVTVLCTKSVLRRMGFDAPILWLYNPEQGPLIGQFDECLAVYHCIDEFTAGTTGRKRRVIARLETALLNRADLVFANSLLTYDNKRRLHPRTYHVPSGVHVEHFAQVRDPSTAVHPAIAAIAHPIAGYIGNINDKLDIPLLVAVATCLPDWQFVLVGQPYPQKVDLRPLRAQPNVHLLGRFPFEEIPGLIKGVDVCLLFYAGTEFARYRSPLKLYEYLAAGKPVVSTDHPEVREFSSWAEIASTPEEFASAVARAWKEDSAEKQRRRAELGRQHSWDGRVSEMEQIIDAYLSEMPGT